MKSNTFIIVHSDSLSSKIMITYFYFIIIFFIINNILLFFLGGFLYYRLTFTLNSLSAMYKVYHVKISPCAIVVGATPAAPNSSHQLGKFPNSISGGYFLPVFRIRIRSNPYHWPTINQNYKNII